jgi:magnesium transporter
VSPDAITDLVARGGSAAVRAWLDATGTLDIADELSRLDPASTAFAFRHLSRDRALAVFESLEPHDQQQVLDGLRDDRVTSLVEEMDPDDRARLFDELPAKVATRLLAQLSPEERASTALLMGYPDDSAGRMMSPEHVSLRASMTVAEAMARIRREAVDAETIYALPVVDDQRRLVGITGLRRLVLAPPGSRIGDLMTSDEVYEVHTDTDRRRRLASSRTPASSHCPSSTPRTASSASSRWTTPCR